jgi:AcrR family transcriptional regulator
MRKLLDAGRTVFEERGFHAARVDDVVKAAQTSHGTFYLYFANKEDLFKALTLDALHDVEVIAAEFPRVTPDDAGRTALRDWVQRFCDIYETHATVIRILSQADVIGEDFFSDGLQLLFRLAEALTQGITSAAGTEAGAVASATGRAMLARGDDAARSPREDAGPGGDLPDPPARFTKGTAHAELTALACLMMLERVNYLFSVGVKLPRAEMIDRISAIIFAAFHSAG